MAKIRNGRCLKTQFDKVILCAGTMNTYVEILSRELQPTSINNDTTVEEFSDIAQFLGYIEETKSTPRWNGVSTHDQSGPATTHAAYIPFDQTVYELDINKLYIRISGTRNRLLKLKGIKNYDEEDKYILMYLDETGFEDLAGAHG